MLAALGVSSGKPSLRPQPRGSTQGASPSAGARSIGRRATQSGVRAVVASVFALIVFAATLLPRPVTAQELHGRVLDREDGAAFEIWVSRSLDLSEAGEPRARLAVDEEGRFRGALPPGQGRYWIFLREWIQPVGGPPMELFLPYDLRGHTEPIDAEVRLRAIHPTRLMTRERLSLQPGVLLRMATVVLLIFGGGTLVIRALKRRAGPAGPPSAPWASALPPPPTHFTEWWAVGIALAVAVGLRLPGMRAEAFDLLEVSYLPGIGRPNPFAEGLRGFAAFLAVVRELAQLWCLDLVHPPLYHALMGLMGLLGPSEWWLRLPALAFSLGSQVLIWRLVRRWSVAGGLLAAAALAVAPPSIYWGQDATPYAAVAFLVSAAVASAGRALESGRRFYWDLLFLALYAGFLCHYNVALVGIGIAVAIVVLAATARVDPRWAGALLGAALAARRWAPVPVFWTWFHFSTFPTVAQDTRLFADTFEPNPGLLPFARDFSSVLGGMLVDGAPLAELAVPTLAALGFWRVARGPRGHLLLHAVLFIAFAGSVLFFHQNLVHHLNGRVYYGFRWVSWYHPLLVGLIALGVTAGPGPRWVRRLAATAWILGVLLAARDELAGPARPDYRELARVIVSELDDRDAVATLPTWFQRGNASHYLMSGRKVGRVPDEGEGVWLIDGKKVTLEPVHAGLPFETTATNSHVRRLWLAVIDERSFGRVKWMDEVSRAGRRWADREMTLEKSWSLGRIRLYRYKTRREALELRRGEVLELDASEVVLNSRTYPLLRGPVRFLEPKIPWRVGLGKTLRYQSPMTPGCVDWTWTHLDEDLKPDAPTHWYLDAMVPLPSGAPLPDVTKSGSAQLHVRRDGDTVRISAVGGPCDGPPLRLAVKGR